MSSYGQEFFEGKRAWSLIKDSVLAEYMPAYIAKVNRLNRPILLIDGYAGPGVFDDHRPGSPMLICAAAEKHAKDNYRAYFFNNDRKLHEKLENILETHGWLGAAKPILGDTTQELPRFAARLRDETVFLYLDPFGPTGSPFKLITPFLARDKRHSTEIVIMMHMPIVHRMSARNAVVGGNFDSSQVAQWHQTLSEVFGGDYWKGPMFQENLTPEEREYQLIDGYRTQLLRYLPFVGYCPVRESTDRRIKYFIVFASRHPDAMLLMNDAMIRAYNKHMHERSYAGTLFESIDWKDMLSTDGLEDAIMLSLRSYPGLTRKELWQRVVEQNFMRYLESDYKDAVQILLESANIMSITPRPRKRLNDSCRLYPSDFSGRMVS